MARFAYMLPAFATDFSAAMSMVSMMGGMSALHAPSGCMGNYCSFDEQDWVRNPGMTYCSMLKEDETIFGNDDLLLERIETACRKMNPPFVAVIGSPITALIGTDLQGIAELSEERTGIPTIAVDNTGFDNYQDGLYKAFVSCVDKFATEEKEGRRCTVLGMDKYDYHTGADREWFDSAFRNEGYSRVCFIPGDPLESFRGLCGSEYSFAVSAAGVRMAELLKKRFGTPYGILTYRCDRKVPQTGKRCLVVGDQVISNYVRDIMVSQFGFEGDVGTMFGFEKGLSEKGDFRADSEGELMACIRSGGYDTVVCDPMMKDMIPAGTEMISLPHPAVSSKIHWNSFVPLEGIEDYLKNALS